MTTADYIPNSEILEYIYKVLNVPLSEIRKIMKDFHSEMLKGLAGKKSSLKMLPAYVDRPCGNEKGKFIALDLGGTNLRILELELKGKGRIVALGEKRFTLDNKIITGTQRGLFDFIAECLKDFTEGQGRDKKENVGLGFTFSFPIRQAGIASGILLHWTKDFSAKGVVGKDVVRLLDASLARKGLENIKVSALANDTVGTLVSRGYEDPDCDIGVILGTGTNACYRERISKIIKWKKQREQTGHMIINVEWGNFNSLRLAPYDIQLDNASDNRGQQILEKMVSGMYLGEITRLIFKDLINRRMLFKESDSSVLDTAKSFKTEYMSEIEGDRSANLSATGGVLRKVGILKSTIEDRMLVKKICKIVSMRGARIAAAALASVITWIDPRLSKKHTVAIDGSVYEKYPGFAQNIKAVLRELFGERSANIKMALSKDGSGRGSAIIAAVAMPLKNCRKKQ
jgi:hexokinase